MKILIVEDDLPLANVLKQALEREGHSIEIAHDGERAAYMVGECECDLLLLDLTLPKLDGFEVLRHATGCQQKMRILILSGRSRIEERVRALDGGADDFLVKPFSLVELTARVRALLRRDGANEKTRVVVCDLVIDRLEGSVERSGKKIELTPKEFALLEILAVHPGVPVSRSSILREIWSEQYDKNSNIVDVYINYLRKKIDHGEPRKLVHTIRGLGYSLGEQKTTAMDCSRGVLTGPLAARNASTYTGEGAHSA